MKFTSQEELARGYVNAQRLIGTKRLEAPQPTWTEKEWGALYDTLGRPKELERYTLPQGTELPDGFKFDLGPTFFLYPRVLEEIFRTVGSDWR